MPTGSTTLRIYQELADWYERQSQAQMRDRFLLLAADTAMAAGDAEGAERLRLKLLEHSPHHMLRPFTSFAEAMTSPDVQGYISDLRQTYPPETAEQLLGSLHANGDEAPVPPPPPPAPPRPEPEPEPARQAPARSAEPLKVYRVKDEDAEPVTAPLPGPAPARRPVPARKEVAPAAAAPMPAPRPAAPPPAAAPPRPAPEPARPRQPVVQPRV